MELVSTMSLKEALNQLLKEMIDIEEHDAKNKDSLSFLDFNQRTYKCKKHGDIKQYIYSSIPGHEGMWCQICYTELLDSTCCRLE
jgi:hypothetical protein